MAGIRSISTTPLSDTELVLLYKQGKDLSTLSDLFQRYLDLSYGVCLKYLKDSERAKDAVMDVFELLPQKLLKHEISNFRSWLFVVLKNHCLMQLRSSKNAKVVSLDETYMQSGTIVHPDDGEESKEKVLERLTDCIQGLSGMQKETITLFFLENRCYNDISTITGWDFNKVRSLIQNGKRNLKICMDAKNEEKVGNNE